MNNTYKELNSSASEFKTSILLTVLHKILPTLSCLAFLELTLKFLQKGPFQLEDNPSMKIPHMLTSSTSLLLSTSQKTLVSINLIRYKKNKENFMLTTKSILFKINYKNRVFSLRAVSRQMLPGFPNHFTRVPLSMLNALTLIFDD